MIKVTINDSGAYDFDSHSSLSAALWDNTSLKDDIRVTLLKIVDEFINFLKIDVEIKDIQLTGSLANYNIQNLVTSTFIFYLTFLKLMRILNWLKITYTVKKVCGTTNMQ